MRAIQPHIHAITYERERVPSEFGGLRRERGGGGKGVAGGRSLGMEGGGSSESEEAPSP